MENIDFKFQAGQVLKAEMMNTMVEIINKMVEQVDTLPVVNARIETNRLAVEGVKSSINRVSESVQGLKDSDIDLPQKEFERLQEAGELDETKNYYVYEEQQA